MLAVERKAGEEVRALNTKSEATFRFLAAPARESKSLGRPRRETEF